MGLSGLGVVGLATARCRKTWHSRWTVRFVRHTIAPQSISLRVGVVGVRTRVFRPARSGHRL